MIDTMTDELKEKGIVPRFMQKLQLYYPVEYQARHMEPTRKREQQD